MEGERREGGPGAIFLARFIASLSLPSLLSLAGGPADADAATLKLDDAAVPAAAASVGMDRTGKREGGRRREGEGGRRRREGGGGWRIKEVI